MTRMLLVAAAMIAALPSLAYQISRVNELGEMAEAANLVFRGEVVDVQYRDSQATKAQGALPHTFVTFNVREVLHGSNPGETLTLRFLGGRNPSGQVLFISGQPMFDIGDEDILFVEGNGTNECPLVGCSNGRIRMIEGMAYTDDGKSLRRSKAGTIVQGRTEALAAVDSFTIGEQTYHRRHGDTATMDEGTNGGPLRRVSKTDVHLDTQALTGTITNKIRSRLPNDPYGARKRVRTVDINRSFVKQASAPTALPEPVMNKRAIRATNEQERAELRALKRNGGNPVLEQ